jgi:hypothetical protein
MQIASHLSEYLDRDAPALPVTVRAAIQVSEPPRACWLASRPRSRQWPSVHAEMTRARSSDVARCRARCQVHGGCLGEAVLSETEADRYARRYLDLLDLLARDSAG